MAFIQIRWAFDHLIGIYKCWIPTKFFYKYLKINKIHCLFNVLYIFCITFSRMLLAIGIAVLVCIRRFRRIFNAGLTTPMHLPGRCRKDVDIHCRQLHNYQL